MGKVPDTNTSSSTICDEVCSMMLFYLSGLHGIIRIYLPFCSGGYSMGESEKTFVYTLTFRLDSGKGNSAPAEGEAIFLKDALQIKSTSGQVMTVPFRDMLHIQAGDYHILVSLSSGASLEISQLGYAYEDFTRILVKMRNELAKEDLLMHEKLLFRAEDIQHSYHDADKRVLSTGPCDAQVSETALILAMPDTRHLKFPLSYVSHLNELDYTIQVVMESGERIQMSMLGRQREPLLLNLEKAIKKLDEEALKLCGELFPNTRDVPYPSIAPFFRDGRAVSKSSLDALSPALWRSMRDKLELCGIGYSFDVLRGIGDEDVSTIGIKRGLMGELTGEYVWFLIPVKMRTVLAMEAGMTNGSGGQATYFFRIPPEVRNPNALSDWMNLISYCLYMINFRREPIYLSEEHLQRPAHAQYKYAIEKLPALRLLRSLFIGRAQHTSEDSWKRAVDSLISAE
jgi:hypothetical protein